MSIGIISFPVFLVEDLYVIATRLGMLGKEYVLAPYRILHRRDFTTKIGYTYEQALAQVSKELGHERADITKHYLK
jgi:hypothetical protein